MSLLLLLGTSLPPRIFYVVGPSAGWSDPDEAEIVAGQLSGGGAATAFGDEEAPTSTTAPFTFSGDATGLTPATTYKIAFVWYDGVNYSNVAVSGDFDTTSAFLAAWARNSNMIVQPGAYA